jgi:hypothetical protein
MSHLCFGPVTEIPRPPVPDDHPPAVPYPAWLPPAAPQPAPRRSIGGFFTAYFAVGLALLVAGFITMVVLVLRPQNDHRANGPVVPAASGTKPTTASRAPKTPESAGPGPNGAALGPQQVKMGKALAVTGENGEKFEVTVTAGKFRKSGCNPYAVKPSHGGYLPTTVKVKVLDGVPDVSEFDFRFQKPDGEWLDSVGGTGCESNASGLFRRLTAGRTYTTTVIFDVPKPPLKGDIIFVWPLQDVIGTWKVG